MARKVLVTGGSGLIGSKLHSNQFIEYTKLDRKINLLEKNSEKNLLNIARANNFDSILHLAWTANSRINYENDYTNYLWAEKTIKFAELSTKFGISFITIGSGIQFEAWNTTPYVESKRLVEFALSDHLTSHKITCIRIFWVVDIIAMRPRLIAELFDTQRTTPLVVQFGNTSLDYIFSGDVTTGIEAIIKHDLRGVIELGSGFLTQNKKLIKYACDINNLQLPSIKYKYKKNGVAANISKLIDTGWKPVETIENFSSNLS